MPTETNRQLYYYLTHQFLLFRTQITFTAFDMVVIIFNIFICFYYLDHVVSLCLPEPDQFVTDNASFHFY
jgi:hypothetical protein